MSADNKDDDDTDKEKKSPTSSTSVVSSCACQKIIVHIHLPAKPTTTPEQTSIAVDCHCPSCRKFHVAAFASYLNVPSNQVDFGKGCLEEVQTYRENCSQLGPVERLFCKHCYTKIATRPLPQNTTEEETKSEEAANKKKDDTQQILLINMGGLVDKTIPKVYKDAWKNKRTIWQESSQASWTRAQPLPKGSSRGMRMPPLPMTAIPTGSCACGQCHYEIRHMPYEMQHCYCHLCRQFSGSAFQTWIPVDNNDFVWKAPATLVRTTQHGQRHFCTTCGSCLTIVYDADPDTTWPAAGALNDERLPSTPDDMSHFLHRVCHICCIWKPSWYSIPKDGLEQIKYAC